MGWLSNWSYDTFGPKGEREDGHLSNDQLGDWLSHSYADDIGDRDDIRAIGEAHFFEDGFSEADRDQIVERAADNLYLDHPVPPEDGRLAPPPGY